MDETEYEEQGAGALPSAAMNPSEYLRRFDEQRSALQQAREGEATTRREMFEQAQQRLQAPQGLRFGSPEVTQTLFGLANALVSPRPYGGFAGTMANVMPVLSQSAQSMNEAQQQRAAALRELQEQYQLGTATAATEAAESEFDALGTLARFYDQPAPASVRYDPNPATGGYTIRPGTGGVPPTNTRGHYIVNSPEELDFLRRMAPDAVFVAADDPTSTPRNVTPR
jgi:hypothetical protein